MASPPRAEGVGPLTQALGDDGNLAGSIMRQSCPKLCLILPFRGLVDPRDSGGMPVPRSRRRPEPLRPYVARSDTNELERWIVG